MTLPQPILRDQERQEVKRRLHDLKRDVTIRLFTQSTAAGLLIPGRECRYCPQTEQLYRELAALSPRLHLEVLDFYARPEEAQRYGVERIPCAVFSTDGDGRFRYYGIPLGYEFATVLETIVTLSKGTSPLKVEHRKKLKQVQQDVHVQVFVTPG